MLKAILTVMLLSLASPSLAQDLQVNYDQPLPNYESANWAVFTTYSPAPQPKPVLFKLSLAGYITSAFVDTASTSYGYGKGIVHEANPLLAPIVDKNIYVGMGVKGAVHAAVAWFLLDKQPEHPKAVLFTTIGLWAAQSYVDYRNIKTLNAR